MRLEINTTLIVSVTKRMVDHVIKVGLVRTIARESYANVRICEKSNRTVIRVSKNSKEQYLRKSAYIVEKWLSTERWLVWWKWIDLDVRRFISLKKVRSLIFSQSKRKESEESKRLCLTVTNTFCIRYLLFIYNTVISITFSLAIHSKVIKLIIG